MTTGRILRGGAALLLLTTLAACSGSSGSSGGTGGGSSGGGTDGGGTGGGGTIGGTGGGPGGALTSDELAAALNAEWTTGIEIGAMGATLDMPGGSATYSGVANVGIFNAEGDDFEADMLGDLELAARFDDGAISGTASGFTGYDGMFDTGNDSSVTLTGETFAVGGTLTVDGTISGNQMTGTMQGELTLPAATAGVALDMTGQFYGDDAAGLLAWGDGDAVVGGQTRGADARLTATRD